MLGIVICIILGAVLPQSEYLYFAPLKEIIYWGISIIFFLYGIKLNFNDFLKGAKNVKAHATIQLTTFLLFPLIVLSFYPFFHTEQTKDVWLAFMFLASLPSTVSSSVILTSLAKGDVALSIFNASLSGLLGIFLTPLWMSFFLLPAESGEETMIFQRLLQQIILPLIIGLLLNKPLRQFTATYRNYFSYIEKGVILLIIYKSFSAAFTFQIFSQYKLHTLLIIFVVVILLFLLFYHGLHFSSKLFDFSSTQRISVAFCGSQKSLVHGSVFIALLITDTAYQGLILTPLLIYHTLQIVYISYKSHK